MPSNLYAVELTTFIMVAANDEDAARAIARKSASQGLHDTMEIDLGACVRMNTHKDVADYGWDKDMIVYSEHDDDYLFVEDMIECE